METVSVETKAPRTRKRRTPPVTDPKTGKFVRTGQDLPPMVPGPDPDPRAAAYADLLPKPQAPIDLGIPDPPIPAVVQGIEVSRRNPFRVWTAGPMMPHPRILTPFGRLKVGVDYAYVLTSPEQVAWAKQALGKQFWPDTVPEDDEDLKCDTCGWTCRNYAAMNAHLNHAHGRPQN